MGMEYADNFNNKFASHACIIHFVSAGVITTGPSVITTVPVSLPWLEKKGFTVLQHSIRMMSGRLNTCIRAK